MDSRAIRLSFVRRSNAAAASAPRRNSPEVRAFVQPHANVSCNAIISDRARGSLHARPRDVEVCIGLTMLRGDGERGGRVAGAAI